MVIRGIFIRLIRGYQKYLSQRKGRPTCRYSPTCSQYAIEALKMHGVVKGGLLSLWRILRCNPFVKGGYDPVRPRFFDNFRRKSTREKKG